MHTQADIFYTNETYCREVLQLREGDRLFSSSRLPFAYGLGNSFTFPLLDGLTTILCREKPAPDVDTRVLSEYRPTIFFGVPVVYRMLIEHHRNVAQLDTTSLRFAFLPERLCRHNWVRNGSGPLGWKCWTASVRPRCCTCLCRITPAICVMAAAESCWGVTKRS